MAKKYAVVIAHTITTRVEIEADSASDARARIDAYGLVEAAMDMASDDESSAKIKSVIQIA